MYQVALSTLKEMLIYCDSTYNLEASRDVPCDIQTHWLSSHGMIELACSAPCKEHLDLHASALQTYRYDVSIEVLPTQLKCPPQRGLRSI